MARARLLECMVENTKLEEEIEDPAWVAHLALEARTRGGGAFQTHGKPPSAGARA